MNLPLLATAGLHLFRRRQAAESTSGRWWRRTLQCFTKDGQASRIALCIISKTALNILSRIHPQFYGLHI